MPYRCGLILWLDSCLISFHRIKLVRLKPKREDYFIKTVVYETALFLEIHPTVVDTSERNLL